MPTANDADAGTVHRVRFQKGSQECWASVHSVVGVPLLVPRATGKATAFGEERYTYGMSSGVPDSLGRTLPSPSHRRGVDRRLEKLKMGGLDTRIKTQSAMLGLEWARTKKGKEEQISNLWSDRDRT